MQANSSESKCKFYSSALKDVHVPCGARWQKSLMTLKHNYLKSDLTGHMFLVSYISDTANKLSKNTCGAC